MLPAVQLGSHLVLYEVPNLCASFGFQVPLFRRAAVTPVSGRAWYLY
jgi:hypothetical protein